MPCYDPDTHLRPPRLEARINSLTKLLCGACKLLEKADQASLKRNKELNDWWEAHKANDAWIEAVREKKRIGKELLTVEELSLLYHADNPAYDV